MNWWNQAVASVENREGNCLGTTANHLCGSCGGQQQLLCFRVTQRDGLPRPEGSSWSQQKGDQGTGDTSYPKTGHLSISPGMFFSYIMSYMMPHMSTGTHRITGYNIEICLGHPENTYMKLTFRFKIWGLRNKILPNNLVLRKISKLRGCWNTENRWKLF